MGRVFDLAQVYGAIDQAEESKLRREGQQMQNERMKMTLDEERLIQSTAAEALGPDGMYDPRAHVAALSKSGRGDLAYKLKREVDEYDRQVVDYIDKRLATVTAETYPQLVKDAEEAGIDLPDVYDPAALAARAQEVKRRIGERWGPVQQVPGARPGVVAQQNLATDEYGPILDYPFKGRSGRAGGSEGTGPERIIEQLMDDLGISYSQAFTIYKGWDPEKSADDFYQDMVLAATKNYDTPEKARQKALTVTRAFYPGYEPGSRRTRRQPEQPQPDPEEERRRRADPAGIFSR